MKRIQEYTFHVSLSLKNPLPHTEIVGLLQIYVYMLSENLYIQAQYNKLCSSEDVYVSTFIMLSCPGLIEWECFIRKT